MQFSRTSFPKANYINASNMNAHGPGHMAFIPFVQLIFLQNKTHNMIEQAMF